MTKKFKGMSEEEIATALDMLLSESKSFAETDLSKERKNNADYYDGDLPKKKSQGTSGFVSQDVFDAVESMKAQLLETFAAGSDIGTFQPNGPNDVAHSKIAALYVDNVIFAQNEGYTVMHDGIYDGLMGRIGVAKVLWKKDVQEVEETFENLTEIEFAQILNDDKVEPKEIKESQDAIGQTLYSGTIVRKENCSKCIVDNVEPENYLIGPRARKTYEAFEAERQKMTRSDMRKRGIDEELIDKIGEAKIDKWTFDAEVLQRFKATGASSEEVTEFQEQIETVYVHECYGEMDVDGTGKTSRWRVLKAGKVILEKEKVRRSPYIVWAPLRKAHSVMGSSFAKKIIATQNAKTALIRGVLDHTMRTNAPRWTVLKGTLPNPNEMTDQRQGGLVNVNKMEGIKALEQPALNPFVMNVTQQLDVEKEQIGVSKLAQGLNKDALSKQNSQGLVEGLTSLSMLRSKIIARNFANHFIIPLYELVYEVICENEDRAKIFEVAGQWIEVKPYQWQDKRKPFRIGLALGYGEKDQQKQKWMAYDAWMEKGGPGSNPLYTPAQKFNVASRILEADGIRDINSYLMSPDKVQPSQPDPLKVAELQNDAAKTKNDQARVQIEAAKLKLGNMIESDKHATAIAKVQSDHAADTDKIDLANREFAHRVQIDAAELALQKATADADRKAIITTHG